MNGRRSAGRGGRRLATMAVVALGLAGVGWVGYVGLPEPEIVAASTDWERFGAAPTTERHVYWVGHSLINARGPHRRNARNLMEEVGRLAEAAGSSYAYFDHTVWGSPLSLNWKGHAHSWDRHEPELVRRMRRELEHNGRKYDVLVMTEGIPVQETMQYEFSSYYAQKFYCSISHANPDARVYVYESWTGLNGFETVSAWEDRLREDRTYWELIADEATAARVPEPDRWSRLAQWVAPREGECNPRHPIFIVPVGTAFAELSYALRHDAALFRTPDGSLTIDRFFANPVVDGPNGRARRYPDEEVDDVHPSWLGVHFVALVHFATLYRRSPIGLPAPEGLAQDTADRLQRLVWDVVSNDPRTGVAAATSED